MGEEIRCWTCSALWTAGAFSDGCKECGGGALDCPCLHCGGECGSRWEKMLIDTHERHVAHWMGGCAYPPEKWMPLLKARLLSEPARVRKVPSPLPAPASTVVTSDPVPVAKSTEDAPAPHALAPAPRPKRPSGTRHRTPSSPAVPAWLDGVDATRVGEVHRWLVRAAGALRASWRYAKDNYVSEGDSEEYEFYKASMRWAAVAEDELENIALDTCPSVKALLDRADMLFRDANWTEPCPARDSFAKRIDAVWRHGAHALTLPLDEGDAPFDALT